jgi:hypothetical protein
MVTSISAYSQWQQRVEYTMNVDMNEAKHQYSGDQKLVYYNNSPDELNKVFYHLYFNAFQPGSMMDERSRWIEDPDSRVGDRILHLTEDEQGWLKVMDLKMNGKNCTYEVSGTILEVTLPKAIKPGEKATFTMTMEAQVPLQVRRSGWMNSEGVEFSMSQWYPKLCEYDHEGWHSNPYIGREFHGIWGDYAINVTMDGKYVIGGSGVLLNPTEVGYDGKDWTKRNIPSGRVTWKFKAEKVHDFAWAADQNYIRSAITLNNGTVMHFIHKDDPEINENWLLLPDYAKRAFEFLNENYGEYPYSQYTVIQGGDGGMEYPMTTLITGGRNLRALVSVTVHEGAHSWYQGVLATNESQFYWMDEGFTQYVQTKAMRHLFGDAGRRAHEGCYQSYFSVIRAEKEEALTTHADHFNTNFAYGVAAYSKGELFLAQLEYVIGEPAVKKSLQDYFTEWKFKHPTPTDLKKIMEKNSGLELDWYFDYFINSTHTIDYSIRQVLGQDGQVTVNLERIGRMPMPVELVVSYRDGSTETYYIPLRIMRGERPMEKGEDLQILEDWPWTNVSYALTIDRHITDIQSIEIDPSLRMADVDRSNNTFELLPDVEFIWRH